MNIVDLVSNHVFGRAESILADGTTSERVKEALKGLDETLKGLSESEIKSLFEDTSALKSYADKRVTDGISAREKTLKTEFETEKRKLDERESEYKKSIETLKSRIPMSDDPASLRSQALNEPDPGKREMMLLRADNIEVKQQLEERSASEAKQLEELRREKLINVARSELGDRKLPKSLQDKLHMFIGPDEDTTKGKVQAFAEEWDNFTKDIKTAGLNTQSPGGAGDPDVPEEEKMKQRLDSMSWLDK